MEEVALLAVKSEEGIMGRDAAVPLEAGNVQKRLPLEPWEELALTTPGFSPRRSIWDFWPPELSQNKHLRKSLNPWDFVTAALGGSYGH